MLKLTFNKEKNSLHKVLCLGAHSDDIEIGCGGTVLKLIETFPDLSFYWVVFGASDKRREEALASAESFLKDAGEKKIIIKGFRDGFFPFMGAEIKDFFEQLKKDISPDLIFTHYRQDLHQDHQLISNLTWNTFRNHLIWEYEIPKYDGDLGTPNVFVHLSESICQQKINYLMKYFATQSNKHWFSEETFSSILRIRGIESNSPDKYSEAFYCRKSILF
jgi:LmbE family N-acetylglucosaminyl deacetylase